MFDRLLIAGLGSIGQRHARVARRLFPGARIVGLRHRRTADPTPEAIDEVVWSVDEAIAFAPQAAVIASPASAHLALAMQLADAGIPMLIEKPIAMSAAGVHRLLETCNARGIAVLTGYNLRYLPSLAYFRSRVLDGAVGDVLSVRAEVGQHLSDWRPGADYRQSVSSRAELGGGVLLELSHEFDYLRWILGEATSVSADTARSSALEIDVEDTAFVTIRFKSSAAPAGVLASVALDFVRRDTTRACTVIGSETSMRWNGVRHTVERFVPRTGNWEEELAAPIDRDATYEAEWLHFAACALHGAVPLVDGLDGLAAVSIADAARESAASGRTVTIGTAAPQPAVPS
jgi:predicted dehydrogenase